MDFFASQDLARRNTRRLIFWLIVGIGTMIAAIYLVVVAAFGVSGNRLAQGGFSASTLFQPGVLGGVAGGVLSIVTAGSAYKIASLRGGGMSVASLLGGRRLQPNTTDPDERRVLNVVEEMAIASGTPVPPVFLLDNEPGINAFAAGYTVDDAVIGVNRGTIQQLTRDELQGVIAHEFSHILNGDMRMSIRMIGVLHGIQVLALIGYYVLRSSGSGSRRSGKNGGGAAIVVVALAVVIIGWVGLFFARMIKASVSRQREYLADASAVQFTRNPEGIAGALKAIAASQAGSTMTASHAEEASHMFFSSMFPPASLMSGMFATHPPLLDRIRKIDPRFDGDLGPWRNRNLRREQEEETRKGPPEARARGVPVPGRSGMPFPGSGIIFGDRFPIDPALVVAGIGLPDERDVIWSEAIVDRIPESVSSAARDLFSSRSIVFATLLARDEQVRQRQIEAIHAGEGEATVRETARLASDVRNLEPRFRLPVFEILQGTLTGMSRPQYGTFRTTVEKLVSADQQIDLFEFFLQQHLLVHLDRAFGLLAPVKVLYPKIALVRDEVAFLLDVLVRSGHDSADDARAAFHSACTAIGTNWGSQWSEQGPEITQSSLRNAIQKLNQSAPAVKKSFLIAAATAITHDGTVTVTEAELFRALAESLDCPVPPVVASGVKPKTPPVG